MTRHGLRRLAVVTAVLMAAACDSSRNTATKSVLAPRLDGATSRGYTLLTADVNSDQTKTVTIDQRGGSIHVQGSALIVPADAVPGPTEFTFRLHTQPYVGADLSAVAAHGQRVTVFPVPLTLTISFARARNQISDPSKIVVLWVENGTVLGRLPSTADVKGKKVMTTVTHFTEYVPSIPDPNDDSGLNSSGPTLF